MDYVQLVERTFLEKHYHRPSDEYDPATWSLGGIEDLKLLFMVGRTLAIEEGIPQWKKGSEFKSVREGE